MPCLCRQIRDAKESVRGVRIAVRVTSAAVLAEPFYKSDSSQFTAAYPLPRPPPPLYARSDRHTPANSSRTFAAAVMPALSHQG